MFILQISGRNKVRGKFLLLFQSFLFSDPALRCFGFWLWSVRKHNIRYPVKLRGSLHAVNSL
jgi:hypothetical protein